MVGKITPCLSSRYRYYNNKKLWICHLLCHGCNLATNVKMSFASNPRVRQSIITIVFVTKTRQSSGSRVRVKTQRTERNYDMGCCLCSVNRARKQILCWSPLKVSALVRVSPETHKSHSVLALPSTSPPTLTLNLSFPRTGLLILLPASDSFIYWVILAMWILGLLASGLLLLLSRTSLSSHGPVQSGRFQMTLVIFFLISTINLPLDLYLEEIMSSFLFSVHFVTLIWAPLRFIFDSWSPKNLILSILYFKLMHLWRQAAEIRNSCPTILPGFFTDHRLTPPQSPPLQQRHPASR